MKRILPIFLALVLACCFAACKKEPTEPTSTAPSQTTSESATENTTAAQTTTEKAADISFLYHGYWYHDEGSKVVAYKFARDGSVVINTYRRKNIVAETNEPDSIVYGSFEDKGNGVIYLYPDNEIPDEFSVFRADSATAKLFYEGDDPAAGATKSVALFYYDTLDKIYARHIMLSIND